MTLRMTIRAGYAVVEQNFHSRFVAHHHPPMDAGGAFFSAWLLNHSPECEKWYPLLSVYEQHELWITILFISMYIQCSARHSRWHCVTLLMRFKNVRDVIKNEIGWHFSLPFGSHRKDIAGPDLEGKSGHLSNLISRIKLWNKKKKMIKTGYIYDMILKRLRLCRYLSSLQKLEASSRTRYHFYFHLNKQVLCNVTRHFIMLIIFAWILEDLQNNGESKSSRTILDLFEDNLKYFSRSSWK